MGFQPDIIVNGPEGVLLVAEAKTSMPNLPDSEEQLKRYMIGMQCPTGVLITREHAWVYRDVYTARSLESIRQVAEFDTRDVWRQPPPVEAAAFETFVQQWLERLAHGSTQDLPRNVRETLSQYLIPAIASGDVRAAHPRY